MKLLKTLTLGILLAGCQEPSPPVPLKEVPRVFNNISNPLQVKCIDTLGAAKFPNQLNAIPLDYGIGGFATTFGDFFPVAKKELQKGRRMVRVNMLWSDSHSYGDQDIPFLKREAKRYQPLCASNPGRVFLAPFTEHNVQNPDKYLNIVKNSAPACGVVNSVWNGAMTRDARFKNEVHGPHSKPNVPGVGYFYSYDGQSSVDADVVTTLDKHSGAEMFCMWHPRLNGKWSMADSTPRPQRNAWPSGDMLRSLVYLFSQKGVVLLPNSAWIVKSHADNHGPNDQKGDKLLVISPVRADTIVLKRAGQKIGTLFYYGSFEGGGFRYYATQFAYKFGAMVDIFINNKKYGTINPGFRSPPYR